MERVPVGLICLAFFSGCGVLGWVGFGFWLVFFFGSSPIAVSNLLRILQTQHLTLRKDACSPTLAGKYPWNSGLDVLETI